jgi:hypothetical protein
VFNRWIVIALESIFPARCQWDRALDDVSKAAPGVVRLRLTAGAKNIEKIPSYRNLKALWCFDIGAPALDAICQSSPLESLYIENIKAGDLSALRKLTALTVLGLERSSKVTSLADVAAIDSLEGLAVTHFKNVHDLAPLARLKKLRSLAVAGSMWTAMRVTTFQPLAELRGLEYLHLTNIKPDDGSLEPLERLQSLKKLEIANFYPLAAFARLARKLPSTECQWFRPYVDIRNVECKKCGAASMAILTGKGGAMVCKYCGHGKIERHIRDWTAATA